MPCYSSQAFFRKQTVPSWFAVVSAAAQKTSMPKSPIYFSEPGDAAPISVTYFRKQRRTIGLSGGNARVRERAHAFISTISERRKNCPRPPDRF